jgi:hypothetical protein
MIVLRCFYKQISIAALCALGMTGCEAFGTLIYHARLGVDVFECLEFKS